jgi:uncharacterized protein (TIGR03067 family)
MRFALLVTALAVAGLSADDPRAGDGKKAFQGTWTIVSMEVVGEKKKEPKEKPVTAPTVVFDGDKYRIKAGDEVVEEGTFKANAAKTPNRIGVAVTAGVDKGKKWHGVYELEGDTLRAVVGPADKDPPTRLTKPDPGTRAFTLKRAKPAK